MTIVDFAHCQILKESVFFYLGISTFISLILTALTGYLRSKGKQIALKTHQYLAFITISLAIIRGLLAIFSK